MESMDQAIDRAARAKAQAEELLSAYIRDGIISILIPGSSGELGGNHEATVGIHFSVGKEQVRELSAQIGTLLKDVTEPGVEFIYFPSP